MKDKIYVGNEKKITQEPFYSIYRNKDGTVHYYEHNLTFYYRYIGVYGGWDGRWSYTCKDADKVHPLELRK